MFPGPSGLGGSGGVGGGGLPPPNMQAGSSGLQAAAPGGGGGAVGGMQQQQQQMPPQLPPAARRQPGARISVEGAADWNLLHITYEGCERYLPPMEYEDEVMERAVLINWREVLGSELEYTNMLHTGGSIVITDANPIEIEQDAPVPVEQQVVPDAGPWHGVARNLHESLLQMNVFLDNLNVLRQTGYMAALTIFDPIQNEPQQELANQNRAAQWVWKRKALQDAANVLDMSIRRMDQSSIETKEDQEYKDRSQFFSELRKMREYWRIRKQGEYIVGDLGYKIFGAKYNPREVFDISRRAKQELYNKEDRSRVDPNQAGSDPCFSSILQVSVPRDLARRATLSVTIHPDDKTTTNLFTEIDDARFEHLRLDTKKQEQIHWDNALKWAQETLICRSTYRQICKDAAGMHLRRTLIKGDVMVTSLCDDLLIRFELKYFPFEELPAMAPDGDAYLNRVLRTILVAEQCVRQRRPQVFVSLPLTHLVEPLDFRGPKAFSALDIDDRRPRAMRYLSRICQVATHYVLVKMVVSTLKEMIAAELDPVMSFRFMRASQTYSIIVVTLANKYSEQQLPKQNFFIRISEDEIVVQTSSGTNHEIKCYRDKKDVVWAIRQMICFYAVQSTIALAKNIWWFMNDLKLVHCNMNNCDEKGNPAPTVYLFNDNGAYAIFIKFFIERVPEIYVKRMSKAEVHDIPFIQLNYNRLPGRSLIKKIECLASLFRDSDNCDPVQLP